MVHSGWYPTRYRVVAADVLPLIADGPPAGVRVLHARATLHRDRMARCAPSQVLTVEVWDLS